MKRVVVGLSGGVDSAVCAYLLKLAGYEVIGVTLKTWVFADGSESRCCETDEARAAADKLDIPYYVRSCIGEFRRYVTEPFVSGYLSGKTPSPCTVCNRYIKWDKLIEAADAMNADYIATGHYAQIVRTDSGRYAVRQSGYAAKDQSYMLYRLTQEQLAVTVFPLGRLTKDEVRRIAAAAGLSAADKPDSQELCFVPTGRYTDFIEDNSELLPPEGDFIDTDGRTVGRHGGIYKYTVGQRKGLGIAAGYPVYVSSIDPTGNTVTVGSESSLYSDSIICGDIAFMGAAPLTAGDRLRAAVKIRYRGSAAPAEAEMLENGRMRITFERPVRAAAAGQSAVLYDADGCVLCGGTIEQTEKLVESATSGNGGALL